MISSEFELIDKIKKIIPKYSSDTLLGIGDDAAVVKTKNKNMVITTDSLVEKVHFDFDYFSGKDIGHKALAVNLSDIAAMGATPKYATVSIGIREGIQEKTILDIYRGLSSLAKKFKVDIIGGNLSKSFSLFFIDICLVGFTDHHYLTRAHAQTGDLVAFTGKLGLSAKGLHAFQNKLSGFKKEKNAHLQPRPRVKEGNLLLRSGYLHSMIDISDGLYSELYHLREKSKVGFKLYEKIEPTGEDYELLFTFPSDKKENIFRLAKKNRFSVTLIGEVVPYQQGITYQNQPIPGKGWRHF